MKPKFRCTELIDMRREETGITIVEWDNVILELPDSLATAAAYLLSEIQ